MNNLKERQEFENYRKLKLLGEGSFGKAFLVERASDNLKCVMKQIDITKMSENEKKETVQEAKILEALAHPNIVKFIEVYKTKKGKLCIVMDFADGGDLQDRIKQQKGRYFTEAQVLEWFTQLCLGLKHIHDRKIIHRDLKGQNVFLTKQGIVKVGDFGIAKVLSHTLQNAKTVVGTPYYLSPEIVSSKPYNFKSDIWSLGVMLYEMCALKPPFDAPSLHFLAMKIVRGAYNPVPTQYSPEMKSLVGSLLNVNDKLRPDVNKILSLPIIQNRIKSFLTETVYQKEFSHTILHKQNVFNPKNQIVSLQNQIQQQKAITPSPAPSQAVPRYQPGRAANATPTPSAYQPPSRAAPQNVVGQPLRQAPPKNNVSPGMAAAFGYNPPSKAQPKPAEVPKSYGVQNYQPSNQAKPNYHYQQPAPQQQQPSAYQQAQALKDQQDRAKRLEEQRLAREKMDAIDRRLKEKEDQLKKLDDAKKQRELEEQKKRHQERDAQYQMRKQEDDKKKQQIEAQEAQKRRMQEDQSRKIQEAQQKRKEEIDKLKADDAARRKKDEQRKAQEQASQEERKRQQAKQEQQKQHQQQQQKKKEDQANELDWVRKMTEDAQNQILDIDKKIQAKNYKQENQGAIMMSYDPPKAAQKKPAEKPKTQRPKWQNVVEETKQEANVQKVAPKEPKHEAKSQRDREEERKQMLKELREKGMKDKNQKKGPYVEILGMEGMEEPQPPQRQPISQKEHLHVRNQNEKPKSQSPAPVQRKSAVEVKKEVKKYVPHKQSEPVSDNERSKSPCFGKVQSEGGEQKHDQSPVPIVTNEGPQEDFDVQYSNEMNEEYKDVYQMYEEMLQLVKGDINSPDPGKGQEEEKLSGQSSDKEGFNDERDDEWEDAKQAKDKAKASDKKDPKANLKKRFDETLSTVQECEEPEQTFQNTHQQNVGSTTNVVQDIKQEDEDRDDIDDDETAISEEPVHNPFKDFTFANAGGAAMIDEQFSKFTSVEHIRDYLEGELGDEKVMMAYHVLKEMGDQILFEENSEEIEQKLGNIMTKDEMNRYKIFFASLIVMELEAEREDGGANYGVLNAMKTLKGINVTGNFGHGMFGQ